MIAQYRRNAFTHRASDYRVFLNTEKLYIYIHKHIHIYVQTHIDSQFSFVVVMFCEVAGNTELANTEPWLTENTG